MKIINKTHWKTEHLRAITARIAAEELNQYQAASLRVTFVYTHKSGSTYCSGYAFLPRRNGFGIRVYDGQATIRLSKHTPDKVDLAHIIAHEFAHTRGMRHPAMKGDPRYDRTPRTREIYSWASEMPLEVSEPPKKAKPGPDLKLEHAEKMLALNERKLKRYATICKKWRLKVRYYERKKAAMNPPPKETTE